MATELEENKYNALESKQVEDDSSFDFHDTAEVWFNKYYLYTVHKHKL